MPFDCTSSWRRDDNCQSGGARDPNNGQSAPQTLSLLKHNWSFSTKCTPTGSKIISAQKE